MLCNRRFSNMIDPTKLDIDLNVKNANNLIQLLMYNRCITHEIHFSLKKKILKYNFIN